MYDNTSRVIEVDINEILPNRFQPRIQFDEEEILDLSDSIKEHGVIQPLVVRTIGDKYEIIAGERRYKASVLAGKETVPVIVKNLNDKDSAEIALIENVQRKNLTPIEEALSYKKILDMGYITQENLASKLGKSQSAIANKIRLLNLSDEVQEALLENKISERHARSLLKLSIAKQQNEMLNRIVSERLTVRRTDEEIEKMKNVSLDESNDDSQKIIEKGEIDMNNNMFGMPNIPQNPQTSTPSFDIFGTGNQQSVVPEPVQQPTVAPVVEPVQTQEMPQTPNFDIFAPSMPVQQVVTPVEEMQPTTEPEVPSMSSVVPEIPAIQQMDTPSSTSIFGINPTMTPVMENIQNNENQTAMSESLPTMPEMPTIDIAMPTFTNDTVNIIPEITPVEEIQPTTEPEVPSISSVVPEVPTINQVPEVQPVVPQTSPIMESPVIDNVPEMTQQSENLFSFGDSNVNTEEPQQLETPSIPEFKMPEPIIVTDFSKQYDPVMPLSPENVVPTVDFKEVINAIRECSNKIEQYGFKIDVEEYDLANLYQVIFKIEK